MANFPDVFRGIPHVNIKATMAGLAAVTFAVTTLNACTSPPPTPISPEWIKPSPIVVPSEPIKQPEIKLQKKYADTLRAIQGMTEDSPDVNGAKVLPIPDGVSMRKIIRTKNPDFKATHPAVISEIEFFRFWYDLGEEVREAALDAYAEGITQGMIGAGADVVILEVGHQSKPSEAAKEAVDLMNSRRKKSNQNPNNKPLPMVSLTQDTGAIITDEKGNPIKGAPTERDITPVLANKIAKKLVQKNILPIITSPYIVDSLNLFEKPRDGKVYWIANEDVFVPLRYQEEELVKLLEQVKGKKTLRIPVHLNGGFNPTLKDGMMIPTSEGDYALESAKNAEIIAREAQRAVRTYMSQYANRHSPNDSRSKTAASYAKGYNVKTSDLDRTIGPYLITDGSGSQMRTIWTRLQKTIPRDNK